MRAVIGLVALFVACGPSTPANNPSGNSQSPKPGWGEAPHRSAGAPGQDPETMLTPIAVCTEMACGSDNPCCNSCGLQGWMADNRETKSETTPLPTCVVDGCGKCSFTVAARGRVEGETFVVTSWEKVVDGERPPMDAAASPPAEPEKPEAPAPAVEPPAEKIPEPEVNPEPEREANVEIKKPTTLEEASSSLYDIIDTGAFDQLAILAEQKKIRYRLTLDGKRKKWKSLATTDADALLDFFSTEDEEGEGYAVAAIATDLSTKHFKLDKKRNIVGYEAPGSHFSVDFFFKKRGGKLVLTKIEAYETPPQ